MKLVWGRGRRRKIESEKKKKKINKKYKMVKASNVLHIGMLYQEIYINHVCDYYFIQQNNLFQLF